MPFDLKNTFAKKLKVMDQTLASFNFAKCDMNTPSYLADYKGSHASFVKNGWQKKCHNLELHFSKWWFFHIQMEYLGHVIYL